MPITGNSGAVTQDSNNYDEPPRTTQSANRMMTDYGQDPAVKQTRNQAFREGVERG